MNIFKIVYVTSDKIGNEFLNLACCSSLRSVVVYNFSEIESTFLIPFWDITWLSVDNSVTWFMSPHLEVLFASLFNSFVPNPPFLYPWCCLQVEKGCIVNEWVNTDNSKHHVKDISQILHRKLLQIVEQLLFFKIHNDTKSMFVNTYLFPKTSQISFDVKFPSRKSRLIYACFLLTNLLPYTVNFPFLSY